MSEAVVQPQNRIGISKALRNILDIEEGDTVIFEIIKVIKKEDQP